MFGYISYECMYVCELVCTMTSGKPENSLGAWEGWFSHFTTRVPGIELRPSGLVSGALNSSLATELIIIVIFPQDYFNFIYMYVPGMRESVPMSVGACQGQKVPESLELGFSGASEPPDMGAGN